MDIKSIFNKLINYNVCTVEEFGVKIDKMKMKSDEMFDYIKNNVDADKNGFVNIKEGMIIVKYYYNIIKGILKGNM